VAGIGQGLPWAAETAALVRTEYSSSREMTSSASPTRVAIYSTAHSHAPGKVRALLDRPDVQVAGICEPDPEQRQRAQAEPAYAGIPWFETPEEFLSDPTIVAACVEGEEGKCSNLARECIAAGKHIWYDKPAGDFETFRWMIETAKARGLHIQMGYMLRYSTAFQTVSQWLQDGLLGSIFSIRGHMSRFDSDASRGRDYYPGGIGFQLSPHMADQAIWLFGARPTTVTAFLRNDATPTYPAHSDNTLVVLEFNRGESNPTGPTGMAMIDIAAMEASPPTRRFEVYGTRGSAIILEPFEPGSRIRLCLAEASGPYARGEQFVDVEPTPRSISFPRELDAFLAAIRGERPPTRSLDHELAVEETLHRATGTLPR
jgi:predicted dehydrogenase